MTVRRLVVVLSATAGLLCAPGAVADSPERLTPVSAGPAAPVSTELGYEAFPAATRDAAGRTWVAYSHSGGHVSATGEVRIRHQDPGKGWSAPATVIAGSDGYGVGTGALAAESLAQGGRLWLSTIRFLPTGPASATNYSTSVRFWDPVSLAWSTPTDLPAISAQQTIGTGLLVRPDGTVLASAYGTPTGGGYQVGRVYAFDASAGAWSVRGPPLTLAGRHVQEPTLLTLADGRLMVLFRSDAASPYYDYVYAVISGDSGATWGTPYRVVVHGSGRPDGFLLPSGEVVVAYRGFSEPANPSAANPPRLTVLSADGTPTGDHLDVLCTQQRYLYGSVLSDQWIYALEAPDGQSGGGASIYATPLRWAVRS